MTSDLARLLGDPVSVIGPTGPTPEPSPTFSWLQPYPMVYPFDGSEITSGIISTTGSFNTGPFFPIISAGGPVTPPLTMPVRGAFSPGGKYAAGSTGDNVFAGSTGNDWYQLGGGADTLILSSGFGLDVVDTTGPSGTAPSTLSLSITDLFPDSFLGYRTGNHYAVLTLAGSGGGGDNLTVLDAYAPSAPLTASFSNPNPAGGNDLFTTASDGDGNGVADFAELSPYLFGKTNADTLTIADGIDGAAWGGLGNDTLLGAAQGGMLFGGGGQDRLTSRSTTEFTAMVGGSDADTYSITTGTWAIVDDLGFSNAGDTIQAPGLRLTATTTWVYTVDGRHLGIFDSSTGTQVLVYDWRTQASRIETFVLGGTSYQYESIASNYALAPNYLGDFSWEAIGWTTAAANGSIAWLTALAGDDNGPTFNFSIGGTDASETVFGFAGDNTLIGGKGNDRLVGGTGQDVYVFRPGDGQDRVDNATGYDPDQTYGDLETLRFGGGIRAGQFSAAQVGNDLVLTYDTAGADQVSLESWYDTDIASVRRVGIETADVNGLWLVGPTMNGTAWGDLLVGTVGNDSLTANGGDDWITGAAGNDSIFGGTGYDTAAYVGAWANYSISRTGGVVTVTDLIGQDGTDTLRDIERLQFADRTYSLVRTTQDFNGDGSSDLLWANQNGDLAQWQQNGTSYVGGGVFSGADAGWSMMATADFNGDGMADILWQHTSGLLGLWEMEGTRVVGGGVFDGAAPGWRFLDAADFNGDGMADILWQHDSGALAEWQMDGTTYIGGGVFSGAAAGWSLKAVADFSGDGKADLLWQNAAGDLAQWQMNGTAYIGGGVFTGGAAGWGLKAVADFNGDGMADILWQHSTGDLAEWHMNGTGYIGGGVFTGAAAGWTMLGISDFNADGKADILWRHETGSLGQWQMSGTSYVGGGVFNGADPDWTPITHRQLIGSSAEAPQVAGGVGDVFAVNPP